MSPTLRRKIKKVVNEDAELKVTSVQSYNADIIGNNAASWARLCLITGVNGNDGEKVILGSTARPALPLLTDTAPLNRQVVVGDSILKQREGSEIYPKRVDLFILSNFLSSSTYLKPKKMHVRVWIVQSRPHADPTAVPAWNMWFAESAAAQLIPNYHDKTLTWFDPRKQQGVTGASNFRVIAKRLYKFTNKQVPWTNMPFDLAQPMFSTPSNNIGRFKSITLKKCPVVKFASDTSGEPSQGSLWIMVQAWHPDAELTANYQMGSISIYERLAYKEDPGC